jgi:hypothetical protein
VTAVARAVVLGCVTALATVVPTAASARPPRPKVTPEALDALGKGALVLPGENAVVPLAVVTGAAAKPPRTGSAPPDELRSSIQFVAPPPRRLELTRVGKGEALVVIDDDLYRLRAGAATRVAEGVGADPAASDDASVVVSIEDKRQIRVTRGETSTRVSYRRPGQWELERPWISGDGKRAIFTVHEITPAGVDLFDLVLVDVEKGELEELKISRTFAPGPLRQTVGARQVLFQMFTQQGEEDGRVLLSETDLALFDLDTKKMTKPPTDVRPGVQSPSGKHALAAGRWITSDDKRCGADRTLLLSETQPPRLLANEAMPVTGLDFLPDESGVVAAMLDIKSCKLRGLIVPLGAQSNSAKPRPFALPWSGGRVQGRVVRLQ